MPTQTATATTTDPPQGTPTTAELRERSVTFVDRLAAGEYETAREVFAPSVADQVSAATLETIWADLQRAAGAFIAVEGTEPTTVQSYAAIVVTVQFSQARQGIRVVFDDNAAVVGFQIVAPTSTEWTAPQYVDRGAIEPASVSVPGPAECALPGEVTVPADSTDGQESPSFVLLGGSGPTDLNGTVGPNQPYKDLAYGLGTAGNASLRYTKRTAVCSVDPATLTIDEEYTDDAVAAVETLRSRPGTESDRTVVVGHSLGALLAPRVASRLDGVAGVVMFAPPGRPLHELFVMQTRYLAELDGSVSAEERDRINAVKAAADRIDRLDIADRETVLGGGHPYWESLREYDAFATARSLSKPMLILHGGRDYQVTDTDIDRWREALAGQSKVRFETYPDLNHLFIPGDGPASPAEYQTLGHVDEAVIGDLDGWLEERWEN